MTSICTDHVHGLSQADRRRHSMILDRFEREWKQCATPDFNSLLTAEHVDEGPLRTAVLIDLALADAEIRRGKTLPLEVDRFYLAPYPEITSCKNCFLELYAIDFNARSESSPRLTVDRYLLTVPQEHRADLERRLARFQSLQELGRGGCGIVFKARDVTLGRLVALKIPLPGMLQDKARRQRFGREARAAADLDHPGIVKVFEIAEHEGQPCIVSELVTGETLADYLAHERPNDQKVALIVQQVAAAVAYAHGKGVLHRDIKPSNVMIVAGTDTVKLMDFGLARNRAADSTVTVKGQIIGTPAYMSPEQADGKDIDPRSDVYSIGVLLYEMLTLKRPFDVANVALLLKKIAEDEPPRPRRVEPNVPRDLETICLKCLEKEPEKRYQSAAELEQELGRYRRGEPILARPAGVVERVNKFRKRKPAPFAAWCVSILGGLILVAGIVTGVILRMQAIELKAQAANKEIERRESELKALERQHEVELAQARDQTRKEIIERDIRAALNEEGRLQEALNSQLRDYKKVHVLLSNPGEWKTILSKRRAILENADKMAQSVRDLVADDLFDDLKQTRARLNEDDQSREVADALERLQINGVSTVEGHFLVASALKEFPACFAKLNLDPVHDDEDRIGGTIKASSLRYALVAALDYWSFFTRDEDLRPRLLRIAAMAAPNSVGDKLRDPQIWKDPEALQKLADGLDLTEQSPQLLGLLAWSLHRAGRDAAPLVRRALLYYPNDFWLQLHLGSFTDQATERVSAMRAALAIRPESTLAYNNLGSALMEAGDLTGARVALEAALQKDPVLAGARDNLSVLNYRKQDWQKALECSKLALTLDADDPKIHLNMGNVLLQLGDVEGAKDQFQKALDLAPDYAPALNNQARALYDPQRGGDLKGAIDCLKKALLKDPNYAEAHYNLGLARFGQQQFVEAIDHLNIAIKLNPRESEYYFVLSAARQLTNDRQGAIAALQKVLELNPRDARAENNLGTLLADTDVTGAIQHAKAAVAIDPGLGQAQLQLGQLYQRQGRFVDAEKALGSAQELLKGTPLEAQVRLDLNRCRAYRNLDEKLARIRVQDEKPENAIQAIELARLCQYFKKLYVLSARLYAIAFAMDPTLDDKLHQRRLNAACAAAMASCGNGNDAEKLDDSERAKLCQQAVEWLRGDFTHWSKLAASPKATDREAARLRLKYWQELKDLEGVRDLGKVVPEAREACQSFWADVADAKRPPHQNLWANSGSGRAPRR